MIRTLRVLQWCVEQMYVYIALPYEQSTKLLYVWFDDVIEAERKTAQPLVFEALKKGLHTKKNSRVKN